MVIDTSAIVSILFDEPQRATLTRAIAADQVRLLSVANLLETTLVVEARRGEPAGRELDLLLHRARVDIVAVTADQVGVARRAWRRYGKGRHPASLNFGDCFAYALAESASEPLLCVGADFAQTELARVLE